MSEDAINIRKAVITDGGETLEGPAYRVDFDEAKEIAEYWLIMNDLRFVGMATKMLLQLRERGETDEILPRCLWTGAMEAYNRSFTTGRRVRLKKEQVFAGQPSELKSHDELLTYRNEHISHSVKGLEQAEAGIRITENGEWKVTLVGTYSDAPPSDIVIALRHISEVAWNWVFQKGKEVQEELLTKAKALGEEKLTNNPTIGVEMRIWEP